MVVALDSFTRHAGCTVHQIHTLERRTGPGDAHCGNHGLTVMPQNIELSGVGGVCQRETRRDTPVLVLIQDVIIPSQNILHGQVDTLVGTRMYQVALIGRDDGKIVLNVLFGQDDFMVHRVDGQQVGTPIGQHVVGREQGPAVTPLDDQVVPFTGDHGHRRHEQRIITAGSQLVVSIFRDQACRHGLLVLDIQLAVTLGQGVIVGCGHEVTGINGQTVIRHLQDVGGTGTGHTPNRQRIGGDELPGREFGKLLVLLVKNDRALHSISHRYLLHHARNLYPCIGHNLPGTGIAFYAVHVAPASWYDVTR